jgi:lactoylglutathione lyase
VADISPKELTMRFHVNTHVEDLQASIGFHSKMFGAQPVRTESDYGKWHLENPSLNFAISTRGSKPGVDHLGFQAETPEELSELKSRAEAADAALLDEGATTCCYARSLFRRRGFRLLCTAWQAGRHPRKGQLLCC